LEKFLARGTSGWGTGTGSDSSESILSVRITAPFLFARTTFSVPPNTAVLFSSCAFAGRLADALSTITRAETRIGLEIFICMTSIFDVT
jgi:hypothetical protein